VSVRRVEETLAAHGATGVTTPRDAIRARVRAADVRALADALDRLGLQAQLVTAADTRESAGDFTLVYVFAPPAARPVVTVLASVPGDAPRVPSLATRSFAASRFEREMHDLLGIVPEGHPDLRRLALH